MPTPADLARTPGIPSLTGLACLVLALTLLTGGTCWLTLGWPWALAFGAVGLLAGTGAVGILIDAMRDPACTAHNCGCACHADDRARRV